MGALIYTGPPREILPEDEGPGVTLTRGQLEAWAGRALTDEEVEDLDSCIPNSSIPIAVGEIVDAWDHL